MSTPKSGWIARNDDGFLAWFDNKPRRDDELGIYRLVHGCAEGLSSYLYPEVKPGECIQIGADDPDMPYTDNPGSTHWEGCYRTRGHHNCAVRQVDRFHAELTEAKSLLRQSIDALTHAFTFEEVPISQHQHEMENGRWDGVRGIVEQGEQFLEGYTGELERLRAERDRYREMLERIDRLIPAYPTTAEYRIGRVTREALNTEKES